ncbi:MAG: tetratricopeptide repeat protein [Alphaproteobacteria bacterium]|nr:tetratricopeptide repeat protein [Alphaproteobacteria bacterium]
MRKLFLALTACLCLTISGCTFNTQRKAETAYLSTNYEKAHAYYHKAANDGSAKAQNEVGWMYEQGKGVVQNNEEAIAWYRKAAEKNYAPAQNNLGWMYEQGKGVEQNKQTAYMWYLLAVADERYIAAEKALARLKPSLSITQIAEAEKQAAAFKKKIGWRKWRFLSFLKWKKNKPK